MYFFIEHLFGDCELIKKLSIIVTTISITFLQFHQSMTNSNRMKHGNIERIMKHFAEA